MRNNDLFDRTTASPPAFLNASHLFWYLLVAAAILCSLVCLPQASAQISTVVFSDDFSASTIDTNKYQPDAPFFEGGLGDIHAVAGNGVMQFVGTTTQQWWSGSTLRVVPTFTASEGANVAVSIDRVAEAGVGTASRSALWILDETRTKYVLFADVRGEGNWHYNRKIGEAGDSPTGSGPNIAAFDGAAFDDGGLQRMKIVADGKTVKLYLDDQLGEEVKFPFSTVIFEFGSYARANNDTADTTWDNLKVETIRKSTVVFSDDFASNTIDPAKYQPDAPFFEGGLGDIHAVAGNGVMQFVGTTTQQWWSGATLGLCPPLRLRTKPWWQCPLTASPRPAWGRLRAARCGYSTRRRPNTSSSPMCAAKATGITTGRSEKLAIRPRAAVRILPPSTGRPSTTADCIA